jgi:hypothetical protein
MFWVIGSVQREIKGWPIGIHVMESVWLADPWYAKAVRIKSTQ